MQELAEISTNKYRTIYENNSNVDDSVQWNPMYFAPFFHQVKNKSKHIPTFHTRNPSTTI